MSLTKKNIVEQLTASGKIEHNQAVLFVNTFFNQIKQTLGNGENVKLSGFGNFNIKAKTSRPGRNPKTGEVVEISARKVVTFKAGPKLKSRVDRS